MSVYYTLVPVQDLIFFFFLNPIEYEKINKGISRSSVKKLCGHLWYLAECGSR